MSKNISTGLSALSADGQIFSAMADVKYDLSTVEIEVVRGVDGHHSERHSPVTPFIEATISDSGDLATIGLTGTRFDVVQLQLQNGKTPKLNKAIITSRSEVNAVDGTLTIKFEGTTTPDEELA